MRTEVKVTSDAHLVKMMERGIKEQQQVHHGKKLSMNMDDVPEQLPKGLKNEWNKQYHKVKKAID